MNQFGKTATILALAVCFSSRLAASDADYWKKDWTISGVDADPDQRAGLAAVLGKKIGLAPDKIIDPLSRDCETGADLSDIRLRPVTELAAHFGAFWKWPKFKHSREIFGWARCDGSNIGAFAFTGKEEGYLFFEEGIVVHLK